MFLFINLNSHRHFSKTTKIQANGKTKARRKKMAAVSPRIKKIQQTTIISKYRTNRISNDKKKMLTIFYNEKKTKKKIRENKKKITYLFCSFDAAVSNSQTLKL